MVAVWSAHVAADATGVPWDWCQSGDAGESARAAEGAHVAAGAGDELRPQQVPHAGHAEDELRVAVLAESGCDLRVDARSQRHSVGAAGSTEAPTGRAIRAILPAAAPVPPDGRLRLIASARAPFLCRYGHSPGDPTWAATDPLPPCPGLSKPCVAAETAPTTIQGELPWSRTRLCRSHSTATRRPPLHSGWRSPGCAATSRSCPTASSEVASASPTATCNALLTSFTGNRAPPSRRPLAPAALIHSAPCVPCPAPRRGELSDKHAFFASLAPAPEHASGAVLVMDSRGVGNGRIFHPLPTRGTERGQGVRHSPLGHARRSDQSVWPWPNGTPHSAM